MKVAARLKQFDFKQFFIDHGEKVGIGAIGLLVVLSLWGTNWRQFSMTPEELKEKAESAEATINKQEWPKSESEKLGARAELYGKVEELSTPINPAQYAITVPFSPPLHPDNTKITNPRWLAIEDLRADADFVELELDSSVKRLDETAKFVHVRTEEEIDKAREKAKKDAKERKKDRKSGSKKKPEPKKDEPVPDSFKRIEGKGAAAKGGFGQGGGLLGRRKDKGRQPEMASQPDDSPPPTAAANKQMRTNGRGYRYVAVRGVFPLRAQVDVLTRALGEGAPTKRSEIQDLVEFHDFELERQTKTSGLDSWSPWEPVDKDRVKEMLLNDVSQYAPETVSAAITNNVLCMPYPDRVVGVWGEMATHPAIKDFVLTDDEIEQQVKYQEVLIKRFKDEEVKKKAGNEGWDQVTKDMRALERRALSRTAATNPAEPQNTKNMSIREQILDEIRRKPSSDPDGMNERLAEFVKKRAKADDYLLLFRYLDFMVEPGKTYRYRVRAVLANPFHTRQIEEVVDPSIVEGERRVTEFSQPTKPVSVPEDAQFYIKHAYSRAGRASLPNANMDLYQWFASTGTVVQTPMTVQIGQFLAGTLIARVLTPAENTFEKKHVPFSTKNNLVDVTEGFNLDSHLHADVIAAIDIAAGKGTKRPMAHIPDEVLFVDQNGGLMLIDGLDQTAAYDQTKQRFKFQNSPFQNLVEKKGDDTDADAVDMRKFGNSSSKRKGRHHDPRQRKGK